MQGIQSVQAAFSAGAAIPIGGIVAGPAFAAVAAIAAAANIAKISSTQFQGGGGGGGSISAPSVSSIPTTLPSQSAPTLNAPANSTTQINTDGSVVQPTQEQTPVVKAFVVENDITSSQENVSKIEEQATF